jgi:hypothetical protein
METNNMLHNCFQKGPTPDFTMVNPVYIFLFYSIKIWFNVILPFLPKHYKYSHPFLQLYKH